MKRILIFTGSQNYGASASSSSADTAITPDILNAGAIGIYGLVGTDGDVAGNNDKSCLIIGSSGTGVAGAIKASVFVTGGGDLLRFTQGYGDFPIWSGDIQRNGVRRITKKAYTAPVKQVTFIGYNGTSGSMNMPTIAANDEAILLALQSEASTPDHIREQEQYSSGRLDALATTYDVLAKVANDVNTEIYKTNTSFVVSDGTLADFTGTGTAILFTKGSTTARFMIQGASGWTASTGSVTVGDIVGVAPANMISVTFTANILGTSAGHHIVSIGGTQYVVADAGSAAQNATAIAAAINAGTQAVATVSTADVTIVMTRASYAQKVLVTYSADDSSWSIATLTVNTTTGESIPVRYKAAATVSAAATFELDFAYQGETGYFLGGTTGSLHTGIVTSITAYGLKMIVDTSGTVYGYAVQGVLQYTTVPFTVTVGAGKGSGAGDNMVLLEEKYVVVRGQTDSVDKRMKTLPRFASATTNYDIYTIEYANRTTASGFHHDKSDESTIMLAFPTGNASATEFENIVKTSGLLPSASFNF